MRRLNGPRVLQLVLKEAPYIATQDGEKELEVRIDSGWIRSRLLDAGTGLVREYDLVRYRLGYQAAAPCTVCRWGGTVWCEEDITVGPYRNGFRRTFSGGVWVIVNCFSGRVCKEQCN